MKQNKLSEVLKTRNPLSQPREAVKPVNMYTNSQTDNKEINDKSIQVDKTTSGQVNKETTPQTVKDTKPQVVKYTTHLKAEMIKAIKMLAVTTDRKDYEIVEKAIENYLRESGHSHN